MGRKAIDLTGQRFGKLVVVRKVGKNKHKKVLWNCICDCGESRDCITSNLRSEKVKACKKCSSNFVEIGNKRFGKLLVLNATNKRTSAGIVIWNCRCDCGNTKEISGNNLRTGHTKSCGNCVKQVKARPVKTRPVKTKKLRKGERFGRLTIVEEYSDNNVSRLRVYKCKCDCGNTVNVKEGHLKRGNTKSCGCLRIKDLTGKKFGRLTVVGMAKERLQGNVSWECKCDCGLVINTVGTNLTRGLTQSCGCLQVEKARETMKKVRIVLKGKDSPHYDPSVTDEERLYNRYQLYGKSMRVWSGKVLISNAHICQSCNKRGGKLNAHHLNAWKSFPEQRFDTANGITLCEECHKDYHHFNGRGDNTLEEFRDHLACMVGEEHVSEIEETLLSRESEIIGQEEVQQPTHELQTT